LPPYTMGGPPDTLKGENINAPSEGFDDYDR